MNEEVSVHVNGIHPGVPICDSIVQHESFISVSMLEFETPHMTNELFPLLKELESDIN